MAFLPRDLIGEILLRLPVKSLLSFKCLSKSSCALIDSPNFIDSHRSKSSQNINLHKLIFQDKSKKIVHVCDVNFDAEKDIMQLGEPVSSSSQNKVFGYCNGLLLLNQISAYQGKFTFGFSLWNPSTRQIRDIPFKFPHNIQSYSVIGSGLGYDESIDDYKAFFILSIERYFESESEFQVWVFGLKSNVWRRVTDHNFPYNRNTSFSRYLSRIGYFIDGIVHFLCEILYENSQIIFSYPWSPEVVTFDVTKETFSLVPLPICSIFKSEESTSSRVETELHVLEGCICISYISSIYSFVQVELYMREKADGVDAEYIWTKLFHICYRSKDLLSFEKLIFVRNLKVLGYSKKRDKIMFHIMLDGMVWYDIKEKSIEKIELIDKDPNWNDPILCLIETLVSVGT